MTRNDGAPPQSGQHEQQGHGADTRRGPASRPNQRSTPEQARLLTAMNRLLSLEGITPHHRWTVLRGGGIQFLETGNGPAVVLVQGAGGGAANWYRLMGPLGRHFRVLAPDLPGFGLSAAIPLRAPLGRQGAALLAAWLDAVGVDACSVVGTSFGGLLALRLAQLRPDAVRRLVLLGSVGLGRDLPWVVRAAGLPVLGRLAAKPSRWGTRLLLRRLLATERGGLPSSHELALVEYLWASAAAGDARSMAAAFGLFGGLAGQREVLSDAELRAIRPPTLIVWGEHDRFLPRRHAERGASLIPVSELHLVGGASHSPNWEAPAGVLEVLLPFLGTGPRPGD